MARDDTVPEAELFASLGAHFAELATALKGEDGQAVDPDRVVRFAVVAIPHAEHCAVTLVRPQGRPRTLAATGPLSLTVDDLQYATGEGPCLDASGPDDVAQVDDLEHDCRWPQFGPRCVAETGVRSVLAVRLTLGGRDRAALNLYAIERGAFDGFDVGTASIFAPFAAVSVQAELSRTDAVNFEAALSSSRQIGTAVGILMARERLTSTEAFDLLRAASNHLNRRLRDLAEEVEYTGALPTTRSKRRTRTRQDVATPPAGLRG